MKLVFKGLGYILGFTGAVFLCLKLIGAVDWHWGFVLLPWWGGLLGAAFSLVSVVVYAAVEGARAALEKDRLYHKRRDELDVAITHIQTKKGKVYMDGVDSPMRIEDVNIVEDPLKLMTSICLTASYSWEEPEEEPEPPRMVLVPEDSQFPFMFRL